jgi:NitT/TauT family transport system substrate-binding protein
MHIIQSRRDFLATLSAAGAASVLGARAALADEGPPETTTIRLALDPAICIAAWYIADELLRAEGFTEVRYLRPISTGDAVARGEADFSVDTGAWIVSLLDAGEPITALAGVHSGCYELFAHEPIQTVSDLKGKRVGIRALRSAGHLYISMMAAHVGLPAVYS